MQKWGGRLVCQDSLVIGRPKTETMPHFAVDLAAKSIRLTDATGEAVPYYLREGVYIVVNPEDKDLFDIEASYEELTYVIDVTKS